MKGQILIVSGPSGSGKSTLLNRLFKEEDNIYFSISSTTRPRRNGEREGIDYYFVSEDEFKYGIDNDEFLEWACVHKNYYGTSLKPVLKALNDGKIVVFDIDVQGFCIAREKLKNYITSVFVTTKNKDELEKRLQKRNTDSNETIKNRLTNAAVEMEHISEYDYFLINDDIEKSYMDLLSIVRSMRVKSSIVNITEVIDNWKNC
ncbi:guanylate kinase [Campylobacter pinnipediorum]|uniref:guanylate kinase n=1 Tax=Campylobacter pinnipediorum TaxID=1965231 RepID=UPI00084D3397|nr:guanylate kinase [Campylobacter pinnipediorum]AQW82469.1 deoxyguanylate kinase / guanylate kinase [Campylobacter pinnipediorum subsp. pinnipediorum]AQW84139.1 deoxyguanylate kinase / guanylate kinase [Campylobacter pinnipediorum subsp. pinnipediorum]